MPTPRRSAVSLILEGIGLAGTLGALSAASAFAASAVGSAVVLPGFGLVAGPPPRAIPTQPLTHREGITAG